MGVSISGSTRGAVETAVLILVGLLVATLSATWFLIVVRDAGVATDFKVFWSVARSATPYAPADWPFSYPPTMLLFLRPLSWLGLWPAFALWTALSAALYASSLRVGAWWPYALFAYPGTFALATGQVSLIVAALMFAAFRSRWTGPLLGVAFCIKPQLVFLAPLALFALRDWRQMEWMAGTVAAFSLAATAVFGVAIWADWLNSFAHFQGRAETIGVLRTAASPAALAHHLSLPATPFLIMGLMTGSAMLLLAFKTSEHKGASLALACILGSPYALSYDLVAVMPLVIPYLTTRVSWRTVPAAMTVTFFLQVFGLIGLVIAKLRAAPRRQLPSSSQKP